MSGLPLNDVQWVSLDCANTLLEVDWSISSFALRCAAEAGLEVPSEAGKLYGMMYLERLPAFLAANLTRDEADGDAHYRQLGLDWLAALGHDSSWQPKLREVADDLLHNPSSELFHLFPETVEGLERLKRGGWKLIVISNWDYTLTRILRAHGILPYFDAVFASLVAGVEKPDRRLFDLALNRVGAAARRTVHVGDDLNDDIEGALGAGLRAIHFDPSQSTQIPSRIQRLTDLADCLTHG